MDFSNLATGSPFYVLQKSDKPVLQVGVVKSKSDPRPPYQTQTPNIFSGLANMSGQNNVIDVIVTINGTDTPFNNLPVNAESSSYNNGNTFVSCSREATLQAVDGMIQASRKALDEVGYHKTVLTEGETMIEVLNPRYAEEKKRDRSIRSLEERQDAQDRKLDQILSRLDELFEPAKN